jgi:hypothetical protein
VEFHPISPERLPDLARFSRQHGKFRHCSCMRWRLTSTEFKRSTKETRTAALEELVRHCTPIGVLAYQDAEPVSWCSIAPRKSDCVLAPICCPSISNPRTNQDSVPVIVSGSYASKNRA